jgi:hypothetical protein
MVGAEQRLTILVSDLQTVALAKGMDDVLIDELDGTADKSAGDERTQGPKLYGPPLPAAGGHGRCSPGAVEDTFSKATAAHAALVAVRTRYDAVRQDAPPEVYVRLNHPDAFDPKGGPPFAGAFRAVPYQEPPEANRLPFRVTVGEGSPGPRPCHQGHVRRALAGCRAHRHPC